MTVNIKGLHGRTLLAVRAQGAGLLPAGRNTRARRLQPMPHRSSNSQAKGVP